MPQADLPEIFITREMPMDMEGRARGRAKLVIQGGDHTSTRQEVLAQAQHAAASVTMLSVVVDDALLAALPNLRCVSNCAVGVDNIDVDACTRRGVWVGHTPDVLTEATADLTFALLLAAARRLREGELMVRRGDFGGPWHPRKLLGVDLAGKTLGIVGYGRIGQAVARRAAAFGMEVMHTGRNDGSPLFDLLSRSDVVSIHCPLTPTTRHMINRDAFAKMKSNAILLNTARGPIVDEAALVEALQAGTIRGAGLDVFEDEPTVHPGLLTRDDVVLTPHIGSATEETRARMGERALDNALAVATGGAPISAVNRVG